MRIPAALRPVVDDEMIEAPMEDGSLRQHGEVLHLEADSASRQPAGTRALEEAPGGETVAPRSFRGPQLIDGGRLSVIAKNHRDAGETAVRPAELGHEGDRPPSPDRWTSQAHG
jgi:hypothetical protein